jgi:ribonuclease HI
MSTKSRRGRASLRRVDDQPPLEWPDEVADQPSVPVASLSLREARRRPASGAAYVVRTDGAARGNPGPASLGAVLVDARRPDATEPDAAPDATISEYLGTQTNNVAEYTGVVRALELATELGAREAHLLLDSKLIVEQLEGRWRIKDPKLIPLHERASELLSALQRWSARHVPRAQNAAADALANAAIDRVANGGPPVVVRKPRPEPPA